MTDTSSIRTDLPSTSEIARILWLRLLVCACVFIFALLTMLVSPIFAIGLAMDNDMANLFIVFVIGLGALLVNMCAWSWLLSGWMRHGLVPDDMSHPMSTGAHFRALYKYQFPFISICGLIFLVTYLPVFMLMVGSFIGHILKIIILSLLLPFLLPILIFAGRDDTIDHMFAQPQGPDSSIILILIILLLISNFIIGLVYFRYSVGIMSLTLFGRQMSLGEASAYRSEHEPTGLTRRFALRFMTYATCYVGTTFIVLKASVNGPVFLFLIFMILVSLFAAIGIMALITSYLKQMPTAALNPQKSRS